MANGIERVLIYHSDTTYREGIAKAVTVAGFRPRAYSDALDANIHVLSERPDAAVVLYQPNAAQSQDTPVRGRSVSGKLVDLLWQNSVPTVVLMNAEDSINSQDVPNSQKGVPSSIHFWIMQKEVDFAPEPKEGVITLPSYISTWLLKLPV